MNYSEGLMLEHNLGRTRRLRFLDTYIDRKTHLQLEGVEISSSIEEDPELGERLVTEIKAQSSHSFTGPRFDPRFAAPFETHQLQFLYGPGIVLLEGSFVFTSREHFHRLTFRACFPWRKSLVAVPVRRPVRIFLLGFAVTFALAMAVKIALWCLR